MINLAFIPAKSYSKRLKMKNFKKINNKYCLDILIDKILKSKKFKKIFVSTDSNKINQIKNFNKITVLKRKKSLLKKKTKVIDLVFDFLKNQLDVKERCSITVFYPLSILITLNDIKRTISKLNDMNVYSSLIVTNFSHYPKYALFKKKNYYKNKLFNYKNLTNLFASGGSMYSCKVEKLLKYKAFITPKTKAHIVPLSRCIDVDTADDFNILKKLYLSDKKN
jgi:CMP-N-acetylneuraminic acid synthetase